MHLCLLAKSNDLISVILVETPNFFSLFGEGSGSDNYLFHSMRGRVAGQNKFKKLQPYLEKNVFDNKFHEGTKETKLGKEVYLASYSKVGKGDLYVVSLVNKEKALLAKGDLKNYAVRLSVLKYIVEKNIDWIVTDSTELASEINLLRNNSIQNKKNG